MGVVFEQFAEELKAWEAKYAGRPRDELIGLCLLALEREDAVVKLREVMGATNPANAAEGTIRKLYAESIERNAIHGSDSPENAAIVRAIIRLAHELNLHIIAEGVETSRQLELLKEWGCSEVQGYYFARPMTAEAIVPLLQKGVIS